MSNSLFKTIYGHSFIKNKLYDILLIIKNKDKSIEQYIPKGLLLYGPHGVGKNSLAEAFIDETEFSSFKLHLHSKVSTEDIKKTFSFAREKSPAIIYIKNIEEANKVEKKVLLHLQEEIDNLNTCCKNRIFLLATASSIDFIPSELISFNRIDIHLPLMSLDKKARECFLKSFLKDIYFDPMINVANVLKYTTGMNGEDLKRLQREAVLYALSNGLPYVTEQVLIEQANIISHGYRVPVHKEELQESAYHEAAHAVISKMLFPEVSIEYVSIISREERLALVQYDETSFIDMHVETVKNKIKVALVGRVAQIKAFGVKGLDTTARDDLKIATNYAYKAVANWGMDEELVYFALSEEVPSDFLKNKIEERTQIWLKEAKNESERLVEQYWKEIDKVATLLLEKESILETELMECMNE